MPEPTESKPTGCGAFLALVLAVALVWGLIDWIRGWGEGSDVSSAVEAADPAAESETPNSPEAGTRTSEFLGVLRQQVPAFGAVPDYQLLMQGENICDA